MTATNSVRTPQDLVILWSINKAIEFTRAEMCVEYAMKVARGGELRIARDVLLEAVGHVTPDDPRLHFLLGQVAIASEDARLLREATHHLRFLKQEKWGDRLDDSVANGRPEFDLSD
jgi:hypothetical protein